MDEVLLKSAFITTLQAGLRPTISHHLCYVCVNYIHECWDLQFKVTSGQQIYLRNFFMAILFTPRVITSNLREKIAEEIFLFVIRFIGNI